MIISVIFCFLVFCCNGKCPGETISTGHCALFRLFLNQTFGLQCLLDLLLVGITGLDQRQTAGTGLPAQHIHGVLDRDRIYFAEECIRQGQDLQLQLAGSFGVALKPCLAAVVHQLRFDIGDHTDDTLAAQRQQGDHLIIVADE